MTAEAAITNAVAATHGGHCMVYRPSLLERFTRLLGFKYDLGEEPDGHEQLTGGWARTTSRIHFSVLARIRLLFSGKLLIEHTHYANLPIDQMRNRLDLRIYAPWERTDG